MSTETQSNWTFESPIEGHKPVTRHSFQEAAKDMMEHVRGKLGKEGLPFHILETGLWIKMPNKCPIYFYEVRDIAYEAGWLLNGKWVD